MVYKYKELDSKKKIELDNVRKVNKVTISKCTENRNKYPIGKKKILDTIRNGKILAYEDDGIYNQILKIASRKLYKIEGSKANLIIIYSISINKVITCYYRDTNNPTKTLNKNI